MAKEIRILFVNLSGEYTGLVVDWMKQHGRPVDSECIDSVRELGSSLALGNRDVILCNVEGRDPPCAEILGSCRSLFPGIPLIAVSGNPDSQIASEAILAGAQQFVPATDLDLLAAMIHRELEEAGNERHAARSVEAEKADYTQLKLQQSALEAAANGIMIAESTGRITWVNAAFTALTGYTSDEAVGKNVRILKSGGHRPDFYKRMWETILGGKVWHGQVVNKRKDGSLYNEEMTITPVRDAHDKITHFIAVKQDVTQRMRQEEALRKSEERFRYASRAAHEVIWERDRVSGDFWLSEAFESIFHYPPGQRGKSVGWWEERLHPEDRERITGALEEAAHSGDHIWCAEYRFRRGDDTYAEVVDRCFVLREADGQALRMIGSMMDVSENKSLLAQTIRLQKLEGVATLASGIAHNLNNVFTPILMTAEMLQSTIADGADRERIQTIASCALRGGELVRKIVGLAPGGRGQPGKPVDLRRVIRDLHVILTDTFPRTIEVSVEASVNLLTVAGDEAELFQAILNLCVNARDAMPSGGRLSLRAENLDLDSVYASMIPHASSGKFVLVSVADSGSGVPPNLQGKIFEPLFTTKEGLTGTGLGLSTVADIVKKHNGFLDVQNVAGGGASFRMLLPASREEVPFDILSGPGSGGASLQGHGEAILVVDDEDHVRTVTKEVLEWHGYEVMAARDGAEALALFAEKRDRIALVMVDLMMPLIDGMQLCGVLKRMAPGVKILISSGVIETGKWKGHKETLRRMGCDTFLAKPYGSEKLLAALRDLISPRLPAESELCVGVEEP